MTKAEITEIIYQRTGFSKEECSELVDRFFEIIKECLENGENIKISKFGNFSLRQKKARMGRNPKTGKPMKIKARRVLTFKPSNILRKKMNERTRGKR